MTFQQPGDINCCHVNCKGGESGTVGNDHHPQGNYAPGNISLVTFLLLLTKFVWSKFERALLDPQGE